MNNPAEQVRMEAVIRGRVQGVGFRWWVFQLARDLGLAGWVSNQPDGTVLLKAEGRRDRLEELAAGLHRGPRYAVVVAVELEWSDPRNRWGRFAIDHT